MFMPCEFPIDIVITWVDGDDPAHRAKRFSYMPEGAAMRRDEVAGETRYRQSGEILLCVASVLRFASFVRKIFIVTDNQNPGLDAFLEKNFPEGSPISIEIIDHKVIFRGYEHCLPTFNSTTITTMLWRIPGLSEHFLLLNDDIFLIAPCSPRDFYDEDGRPLAYGYWHWAFTARLLRKLRLLRKNSRSLQFRDMMLNAADTLHAKRFVRMQHTPHCFRRSFFEDFFAKHPDILSRQIEHRFRDASQFSAACLHYTGLALKGRCRVVSHKDKLIYLQPKADGTLDGEAKRRLLGASPAAFCCLNSIDKASSADRAELMACIAGKIGVELPEGMK